jgi:cob(I)alamin adenosyltransferase
MLNSNMKIYTKTGDSGTSSLNDGYRTGKESILFSVVGEIDELSSRIGMLAAWPCDVSVSPFLRKIQKQLHAFSAHLASPTKFEGKYIPVLDDNMVLEIEQEIDKMESNLPKLTHFILPGCYQLDSHAHLCRTQTRRVERKLWKMIRYDIPVELTKGGEEVLVTLSEKLYLPIIPKYLNRLSDYFFVLARWLCMASGGVDVLI